MFEVMLGKCGYRCDLCAARSDDPAVRQQLVEAGLDPSGWRGTDGRPARIVWMGGSPG